MMKVNIEIDETQLKYMICDAIRQTLGEIPLLVDNVIIEVKSKQNFKSEWEPAKFRARYELTT